MKKVLAKLTSLYLRVRVKNAGQLGTMDYTSGKVTW
jgi:hypothetical protein